MDTSETKSRGQLIAIIHRYRFIFVASVLALMGGALVVGVELLAWEALLGDLGVAFLAAGTVGLGLEYYTRSQFNHLVRDSVVEAVDATQLEKRISELSSDAKLGEHFRLSGLRRIHPTRGTIPFKEYIESAPIGSEISILGICLRRFLDDESETLLIRKAKDGCSIRMLIIDPRSKYVDQRAEIERRDTDDVRSDIEAASRLHQNLKKHKMPLDCADRFVIRYYDSPVTFFLFRAHDKGVLGFYLSNNRGEFFPQIEFNSRVGTLAEPFGAHFESIWDSAREAFDDDD